MDFEAPGSPLSQEPRHSDLLKDCNDQSDYPWAEDTDTAYTLIDTLSSQTGSASDPNYVHAFEPFPADINSNQQSTANTVITDLTSSSPKQMWENTLFSDDMAGTGNLDSAHTQPVSCGSHVTILQY